MIKMFAISYNEKRRIKSLFKMSYINDQREIRL